MSRSCGYWDCSRPIRADHFLCREHYEDYADGLVDECPGCGRFKYALYEFCLDCYAGRPPPPAAVARARRGVLAEQRGEYRTEHSRAWERGDEGVGEFYAYILKLEDGSFYAGQTRDLRARLMEHRDGLTRSTRGRRPVLVWFAATSSREAAERYEAELKEMISHNPREVRKMILKFRDLISEVDR